MLADWVLCTVDTDSGDGYTPVPDAFDGFVKVDSGVGGMWKLRSTQWGQNQNVGTSSGSSDGDMHCA